MSDGVKLVVVIPAYRPGSALPELARRLACASAAVVIVNDGSGGEYEHVFSACEAIPEVVVLRHETNQGKGAALKTGIAYALDAHPGAAGVVTADADGQHAAADILRIGRALMESPGSLVLGSRDFGPDTPWRSRFGNAVTRRLVRMLVGHAIRDTQTGLRGIPRKLAAHVLEIRSSGYEFELDMLIAAKHLGVPVTEQAIRTIYEPGNPTSHFNPLLDSMRIYFVLLRFGALSLATAVLDNLVFGAAFLASRNVAASQAIARGVAVIFNYGAARRAVFLSRESHSVVLPRYLLLVAASGLASYALIGLLRSALGIPVIAAKLIAESLLFAANFAVQRDFVFKRRDAGTATDWDRYYDSVPVTARLTRRYTGAVLLGLLKRFAGGRSRTVVEIGGANSCFLDRILQVYRPDAYHVVDTNERGLELLRRRVPDDGRVALHRQDVMALDLDVEADVVFSVGLVEHFDPAGTRRAVRSHFQLLKPGGCAIISFPTPTWCYRAARWFCESFGLWHFPDERPLHADEVRASVAGEGVVLFEKTLWPLIFTQRVMVVRKRGAAEAVSA
jgi:glycosyltransferase involved in cell wall biosynthesis/SAM-dependent methyltransferase